IGKIQRSSLKSRFEEGQYNQALRLLNQTSVLNKNTFQAVWQQKQLLEAWQESSAVLILTSSDIKSLDFKIAFQKYGCQSYHLECENFADNSSQISKIEEFIEEKSITSLVDMRSLDSNLPMFKCSRDIESLQSRHTNDLLELLKAVVKYK